MKRPRDLPFAGLVAIAEYLHSPRDGLARPVPGMSAGSIILATKTNLQMPRLLQKCAQVQWAHHRLSGIQHPFIP
jgi:hypothetical protein